MCEAADHNHGLVNERLIITPEMAERLVSGRNDLRVRICGCRADMGQCPRDNREVCLIFPDFPWDPGETCPVTAEEVRELVQKTAARGDVFDLFHLRGSGKITELCSCCTCCCVPLRRLRERGNYDEQLRTDYLAVRDDTACNGCGLCKEVCPFGAWLEAEGSRRIWEERCFGCGRCVRLCPTGALRLKKENGRVRGVPSVLLTTFAVADKPKTAI